MQVLFAVIDDLWKFARTAVFGVFFESLQTYDDVYAAPKDDSHQLMLLPTQGQESTPAIVAPTIDETTSVSLNQEQFFISEPNVQVYVDPVVAFDTVCFVLPYGTTVRVHKWGGRWAYVSCELCTGWVHKDTLREKASDVLPFLSEQTCYNTEHIETKKLRLCIADSFGGARVGVPLTDVELVTYLLSKKGKVIPWGINRPRIAGLWHQLLRGVARIHMGIYPKTDSIMEFQIDDVGHLAYVVAVFPDQAIKIASIGMHEQGVYEETALEKEQWKELRPVFIEVI